jgi:hypothetical protein
MATRFNRQRTPLGRLNSASTLVALLGNEALVRGLLQARVWLIQNWSRGVRETRSNVKPLRKVARRELRKFRMPRGMIPFYPAIPLVPLAVGAGLATFLAVRGSRRNRDLMDRLDAIEADLARLRQQREQQVEEAASEGRMLGSQPAQLPWT